MKTLVSVVVPAYNEAACLPPLVHAVHAAFEPLKSYDAEYIIVNDGSTDDTAGVLRELALHCPRLRCLHMTRNSGQSAALIAGMRASKGSIIVTLDADLQNDPADIPALLEALQESDCVCGYRKKRNDTALRRLTSYLGNRMRRLIVDDGVRDAGCGLKAFRRSCLDFIVPFHGVHRFFAAMVRNGGLAVTEVPVNHHPRKQGKSKYGFFNRFFWVMQDFFGVAWLKKRYLLISFEEDAEKNEQESQNQEPPTQTTTSRDGEPIHV